MPPAKKLSTAPRNEVQDMELENRLKAKARYRIRRAEMLANRASTGATSGTDHWSANATNTNNLHRT